MPCPFLKEGRALYCHAAPFGTMILEGPGYAGGGLCESPEYYRCGLVKSDEVLHERCPQRKYLGYKQRLREAVNDRIGIEPS